MDHEIWLLPLPYIDVYAWVGTAISALAALGSLIGGAVSSRKSEKSSSSENSSSSDLASDALSSGISAIGDIANSIYNQKVQYQNQVKLMDKANEYNSHSLRRAVEDARSLGLSPLSALGSSGSYQSATPTAPLPSMPSSLADLPLKIKQMKLQEDSVKSQNDVNSANAEYLRSLAKGKNLENTFFGDILPLKTQLTQAEYNNAIYLQGYYMQNPELLQAVADKQKVLNENLSSQTDVNKKQLDAIDSIIAKNASDISLNERKIAQSYIQDRFTRAQIQELQDRNLRDNYTNVGYLIDRMKAVSNSSLPDDVKSDKLAMLRDMYDQASGNSRMKLQYQYDKNLQDAKIASQSEQVDKYINFQNTQLDWSKIQFAWNKVFEVVDKVGDVFVPWYQQKQGQDFQREMQQNQFQHDFDKQSYEHQHEANRQFEEHRFKSSENQKDRDQKDLHFSIDQSRRSDEHHNYYQSYESWYDENGNFHSIKHNSKK